jgi:hypothetical protein
LDVGAILAEFAYEKKESAEAAETETRSAETEHSAGASGFSFA